jgi:hypothetical protein
LSLRVKGPYCVLIREKKREREREGRECFSVLLQQYDVLVGEKKLHSNSRGPSKNRHVRTNFNSYN